MSLGGSAVVGLAWFGGDGCGGLCGGVEFGAFVVADFVGDGDAVGV